MKLQTKRDDWHRSQDNSLLQCRYIPNRKLQFEYPDPEYDNVDATTKQDCLQDSNILARPEHEGDQQDSHGPAFGMAEAKYE